MVRKRLTRDESREATRQAILEAAEASFIEHGYRKASLDEIADRAGYSKGAVYSNFDSKADLFLILMDQRAEAEQASLVTAAPPDSDEFGWPLATLDFFVEAVADERIRAELASRYSTAREDAARGIGGGRPDPAWGDWQEAATVAMALGSGLIIQSAIDPESVAPDLLQRIMGRLIASDAESD
jgi:AcrR family transcriptional regulator